MAEEKTRVKDFLGEFLTGSDTESQTLADFPLCLDISVRGWLMLWKFTKQIQIKSYEKNESDNWEIVTLILIQKLMFSSKSYLILFLNGFYHNANIILRTMFEASGILTCIWKNHEVADNWIDDGKVSIPTIDLFNVLFSFEERNPDVRTLYNILCDDVHSNARTLFQQIYISGNEEEPYITASKTPRYDSELAKGRLDRYLVYILLNNLNKYCGSYLNYIYKTELDEYFEDVIRYHNARAGD